MNEPQRKYLPTLGDLVDRRSIVRLKEIFNAAHAKEYREEGALLDYDIDLIVIPLGPPPAKVLDAMMMLMLANRYIWENESRIRDGSSTEPDTVTLARLRATHSINGVRNAAKNIINAWAGGRQDFKIDCYAEDLPADFGNWKVF